MVVGIRVGTNVIPFFRPVLFYRTVTEKPRFIPEQYIYGCGIVTAPCLSVSASLLVIV